MSLRSTIKVYNILLLGPTGVGKSTLVNSIANYFTYDTLDEAIEANEPRCVIPSVFEFTLENFEKIKFYLNGVNAADKFNENYENAGSCTQEPRVYSFHNDEIGFNVIDIPGIGDTRGVFQDSKNIKIIHDKLQQFTEIHGVFILVNATEPRLTTEIQFNLNETLMMLHNSAIKNIMFVLTTSRVSNYLPGSAMKTLTEYVKNLKEQKNIIIELKQNTFCVDNEAFIFQCGWNKSQQYRDVFGPLIENYKMSWKISKDVVIKLFQRMYTLQGHDVKLTCTVGQARTVIHCLIGPLATITTLIQQATLPANRQSSIESLTKSGERMDDTIETTKVQPQTVCTSDKCIEAIPIPGTNRYNFNFKTVCHENCFLKNVPLAKFPEPALEDCQAFDLDGKCMHCGCRVERHMHINSKQTQKQTLNKVGAAPLTKEQAEKFMDRFVEEEKFEQDTVISSVVQLSSYLKQNAILEYNNAFQERLNVEIRKEQAATSEGSENSIEVIKKLQKTLDDYSKEMKVIDTSIKKGSNKVVTEEDVGNIIKQLFTLKHNGANIRKLYEAECSNCPTVPEIPALNNREFVDCKVNFIPTL